MNFDEWWNEDYDDSENPFQKDSFGYWAYAGWCAALAQSEPVALKVYQGEICYMSQDDDQSFGMWCPVNYDTDHGFPNETKFYTKPPKREWVGLTDDEVQSLADTYLDVGDGEGGKHYVFGDVDFARAIEVKLKEKNT